MSDPFQDAKFLNQALQIENQRLQQATNQLNFMRDSISLAREMHEVEKERNFENQLNNARAQATNFLANGFDPSSETAMDDLQGFVNQMDVGMMSDPSVRAAMGRAQDQVMMHQKQRLHQEQTEQRAFSDSMNLMSKVYPEMAPQLFNTMTLVQGGEMTPTEAMQAISLDSVKHSTGKIQGLISAIGSQGGLDKQLEKSLGIRQDLPQGEAILLAATGKSRDVYDALPESEKARLAPKITTMALQAQDLYQNILSSHKATTEKSGAKSRQAKLDDVKIAKLKDLDKAIAKQVAEEAKLSQGEKKDRLSRHISALQKQRFELERQLSIDTTPAADMDAANQ